MSAGYICDRCGATFTDDGKWLQGGYHGSTAFEQHWDLCPDCMEGFTGWMERGLMAEAPEESADCVSFNDGERATVDREHSLESESVREQSESVREQRYESQDVTGGAGRVTESTEMSHDTREKLEEDVREEVGHYFAWQEKRDQFANKIVEWLDRQAAIVERGCMERIDCAECAEGLGRELDARCDTLKSRIAELKAQLSDAREVLDAVWSERDQWRDAYEDSERLRLELIEELEKRDKGIRRLKQRRGELMEQVRMMQDDAARARREV